MDVTTLARTLLEPVPAHAAAGLEVVRAADGAAEVALLTQPTLTNVIGSLHSGGLITLADAAGLAAIIAACESEDEMRGVLPLGAAAALEFRAPARGRLTASCRLARPRGRRCGRSFPGRGTAPGSAPWPTSPTRRTPSCAAARSTGASAAPDGGGLSNRPLPSTLPTQRALCRAGFVRFGRT